MGGAQPEVFETDDAPEEVARENTEYIQENPNEDIEKPALQSKEAFQKFSAQQFDTSLEDYSWKTRKARSQGQALPDETPAQRLQRLQQDVTAFLQDLQHQPAPSGERQEEEVDAARLAEEVRSIQDLLHSAVQDDKTRALLHPRLDGEQSSAAQDGIMKKLLAQLQSQEQAASKEGKGQKESTPSSSSVTYELYYSPDQSKFAQVAKAAEVETRVARLEKLIGHSTVEHSTGSIVTTMEQLKEHLLLLGDTEKLDALHRKIRTVMTDIDSVAEKEQAVKQPADPKIDEMYAMMTRWDAAALQLPGVVARLKALKSLHEQSSSFHNSIKQLEDFQTEMKSLVSTNSTLLSQVEQTLHSNMQTVQTNITTLEKRFKELSNKMAEHGLESY